jgi:hypothetical protein
MRASVEGDVYSSHVKYLRPTPVVPYEILDDSEKIDCWLMSVVTITRRTVNPFTNTSRILDFR